MGRAETETADASEWADMVKKKKHNKYKVAPEEERTYNGTVYHSKAESTYAAQADMLLRSRDILGWKRQVTFQLGPDNNTTVDFVTTDRHGEYVVEVKGFETPEFKKVKKLWKKYGPMAMHIMKRVGNRWQVSILRGKGG